MIEEVVLPGNLMFRGNIVFKISNGFLHSVLVTESRNKMQVVWHRCPNQVVPLVLFLIVLKSFRDCFTYICYGELINITRRTADGN